MSAIQTAPRLDVDRIRAEFPILRTQVGGRDIAYLDNAATSQKPRAVIESLDSYWTESNANVHRGVHYLSMRATKLYDDARVTVQTLLNAASPREIIFTKGCTEAVNLVASCLFSTASARQTGDASGTSLATGDVILVSGMEHHSDIVPWQLLADRTGAIVKQIPITDSGELDLDAYRDLLKAGRVRLVGIVHVSNSLGTVNPIKEIVRLAHEAGALTLVDGAQAGPHLLIDVQDLDADFYTLSCHKIYAPTGTGVLYGKLKLLSAMPPYQGGGDMIRTVSFDHTTFAEPPAKFEPGTPNVAGVVGLGASIQYLSKLSEPNLSLREGLAATFAVTGAYETALARAAEAGLHEIPGVRIYGTAKEKGAIVSFTIEGVHPHDTGTMLDQQGIAIRAGHHCCMPVMTRFGIPATARASFAFYNTFDEVDRLVQGVHKVKEMFA